MTAGGHLFLRRGALGDRDTGNAEAWPAAGRTRAWRVPTGEKLTEWRVFTRCHIHLQHLVSKSTFRQSLLADNAEQHEAVSPAGRRCPASSVVLLPNWSLVLCSAIVSGSCTDECVHAVPSLTYMALRQRSLACHRVVASRLTTEHLCCAQAISDLIDDCLQQRPDQRPTAEQLFTRLQASWRGSVLWSVTSETSAPCRTATAAIDRAMKQSSAASFPLQPAKLVCRSLCSIAGLRPSYIAASPLERLIGLRLAVTSHTRWCASAACSGGQARQWAGLQISSAPTSTTTVYIFTCRPGPLTSTAQGASLQSVSSLR